MNAHTLLRPQDWPIAAKLTTFTLITGIGALAALGFLQSRNIAGTITERQAATLSAVMDERAERVEQEFSFLQEQIVGFAADPIIRAASTQFPPAFEQIASQSDVSPEMARADLARYFDSEYKPRLEKAGQPYRGAANYTPASTTGQIAQYLYLPANPSPVGSKHEYDRAPQDTTYNDLHAQYHPIIRRYLDTFGAYDIFIVAPEGDLVYSVYKETDYATNLASGPYRDTNLAEAYRQGRPLREGQFFTTDYASYEPSYGAAAIFLSSPVYNDGELVAVACMQMPVPKLNALVESPIGETGRTRLIGPDHKIRSVLNESETVMVTTMDSDGARLAAEGATGHTVHTSSSGQPALAVYRPLNIEGLKWSIIGETDMSEVLAPALAMRRQLMVQAAITAVILIPLAFFFARSLSRPIRAIAKHTTRLASGDFTATINLPRRDELGQLAAATNDMSGQIGKMISDVTACAHEVAGAATQIAATSEEMAQGLQQQESQTTEVSSAVDELSQLVRSVAEKSASASTAAESAGVEAEEGGVVVGETIAEIRAIADQVRQSVEAVSALGVKSEQIGEIIAVIDEIADQTNLLALNAAIEAARAGEHGRGFAVVADEVRKLAERTQQATEQVAKSIREIQADTRTAVERIEQGSSRVEIGVEKASGASASLERIVSASNSLKVMVSEIAHAVDEQAVGASQIAQATTNIVAVSGESASAATQAAEAAAGLSQQSENLLSLTTKFKV